MTNNDFKVEFKDEIESLKVKFSEDKSDEDIEDAITDAIYLYLELRNIDEIDLENFTNKEKNWIKRCAKELLDNEEYANIQSYSENGYSITRFSDLLSPTLLNAVVPKVKPIQ